MTEALQKIDSSATVAQMGALSCEAIRAQVALIQDVMKNVMQDGEHFGTIPGCGDKKTLLKPGAEKLSLTFRLAPAYVIDERELPGGHREYRITCNLTHIPTGQFVGSGVGICSTMETKYRWRQAGRVCPNCGAEAIIKGKAEYGGGWVCFNKKGGCGAKFKDGDRSIEGQSIGRVENPDVADSYNTVLKMAKKRAHVDAILTATAASDLFTQDVEDFTAEPVQAPTEQQTRRYEQEVHTNGQATDTLYKGDTRPITKKQAEDLWKAAKGAGFTPDGFKRLLDRFGFKARTEITRDVYRGILRAAEDKDEAEVFNRPRAKIENVKQAVNDIFGEPDPDTERMQEELMKADLPF